MPRDPRAGGGGRAWSCLPTLSETQKSCSSEGFSANGKIQGLNIHHVHSQSQVFILFFFFLFSVHFTLWCRSTQKSGLTLELGNADELGGFSLADVCREWRPEAPGPDLDTSSLGLEMGVQMILAKC